MNKLMRTIFWSVANPLKRLYWFLFRPKTKGAKCFVVYENLVLLIRNSYGNRPKWTVPSGGVHNRETFLEGAKRELFEEVGITGENLIEIGEYLNTEEWKKDTVKCFFLRVNSQYFKIDETEVAEARWFPIDMLPDIRSRRITPMLTWSKEKNLL